MILIMNDIKKIFAAISAAAFCVFLAGCSDSDESGASANDSFLDSADSVSSVALESDEADNESSQAEKLNVGEYLQGVADIYSKGEYTLECTLSSTAFDGEIKLTRVVRGEDVYQLQQEALGKHGAVTVDGKSYDFDYLCGMYRERDSKPELNLIEEIIRLNLEQTDTHEEESSQNEYAVEEYTYTGDTYITVMDFYFDKTDKRLVKYTTTYSVEGQDDVTETRVIDRLDNSIDETVFNTDFTYNLADFNSMSEDQRLGFCQGLCGSFGITTDEMYKMGISTDQFKTIDYNTLFNLVYTYAKGHI